MVGVKGPSNSWGREEGTSGWTGLYGPFCGGLESQIKDLALGR